MTRPEFLTRAELRARTRIASVLLAVGMAVIFAWLLAGWLAEECTRVC